MSHLLAERTAIRTIFVRDQRPRWYLAILLPVSLLLTAVDHNTRWLNAPRAWLGLLAVPLHVVADAPGRTTRAMQDLFTTRDQLFSERDELRARVEHLNLEAQRLAALELENKRLRSLLDSKERLTINVRSAEVVGIVPDSAVQQFILDKGADAGVYVGQAVLSADGLVGQVIEVTAITSRVLLITDRTHAVSTQVVRSGYRVVVEGAGRADLVRVRYVTESTDIEEGDLLISSGLDRLYPAGYPVARVKQVNRAGAGVEGGLFAEVLATPLARLEVASHVLLVFPDPVVASAPIRSDLTSTSTTSAAASAAADITEVSAAPSAAVPSSATGELNTDVATPSGSVAGTTVVPNQPAASTSSNPEARDVNPAPEPVAPSVVVPSAKSSPATDVQR